MDNLRKVTENDIDILFEWANDPLTREMSLNSDRISYETHTQWFYKKMQDSNCYFYILEHNGTPAGTIRLDKASDFLLPDAYFISYGIAPVFRGMGLGNIILKLIEAEAKSLPSGIRYLVGKVKPENTASVCCFKANNFRISDTIKGAAAATPSDTVIYIKEL